MPASRRAPPSWIRARPAPDFEAPALRWCRVSSTRFEIIRTLGEGGMGVVYEARDKERDMVVALKTLRTMDANLLYHFKNEFRSLADLSHPNLCSLYELFQSDGHWFFTMELVEGTDFMSWISPRDEAAKMKFDPTMPAGSAPPGSLVELGAGRGHSGTMLEFAGKAPSASQSMPIKLPDQAITDASLMPFDEPRLRASLAQLAAGLDALHATGKVHRDIKPGNILVAKDGRVVIMDFGLVADDALLAELRETRMIAGTPTFMAPEQGIPGATVGASADWYAVGVMLYQILTSRLPFSGATVQELIEAKRTSPPSPSSLAFGVPLDLADLSHRLLSPDPASRPTGEEVLRLLGSRMSAPMLGQTHGHGPGNVELFVGRRAELGVLHNALAESRPKDRGGAGAVSVFVEGPSGLGKSALVKRFLDELSGTGTLILKGRCYAEETVAYKAFDGIVDALSRHLVTMDQYRVMDMFPQSTMMAARLFPVLRRVPVFANAVTHDPNVSALELRTRAFAAVVELLARVAAMQPLVLFVDDLQWADPDSLLLLREVLHPNAAPPLTFVASIRTGADPDAPMNLARTAGVEPRWIKIQPLSADDAALLVDRILPREAASDARRAEIAREAAGHPLFLAELAHHASQHANSNLASTTQLDEALWQRTMALDHDTRHLLHIIAVAGSPIELRVAADASGLSNARVAPLAGALRVARFVKTSNTSTGTSLVEPYHDRVREAVVTRLDPSQFAVVSSHLAHAMLRAGMAETAPELVVRHLFAAGDTARGRDLAEKAANRSLAALAFDRAAEFLRSAIAAGPRDAAHARTLQIALAEALASGGRGAEAADAYLAAATLGDDEERLDCRRHAADQLLVSGHVDRGLTELRGVLATLGERVHESPQEALAAMALDREEIDSGRIAMVPIADVAPQPHPSLLRMVDVYHSPSLGLLLVDNVRGAASQARALRLAAQAGDHRRLLRALVFEAIYRAQESDAGRTRALELLGMAAAVARLREDEDPWMSAYLVLGNAFVAYYYGQFARAVDIFKDADKRFRTLPNV
ncbi:MAG: protein kinase, partial [Deltaproteobacteria bacterium]|nr:protein kinase [Deltaproteobacteria bacterium]